MKVGDKFTVKYPFKFEQRGDDLIQFFAPSVWVAGCHSDTEYGCYIGEGVYEKETVFWCDAEGTVEFEVLAIVELEGNLLDRAIFRKTYNYPNGDKKKYPPQLMTVSLLEARINKPFKVKYDVEPSKEAIKDLEFKGICEKIKGAKFVI